MTSSSTETSNQEQTLGNNNSNNNNNNNNNDNNNNTQVLNNEGSSTLSTTTTLGDTTDTTGTSPISLQHRHSNHGSGTVFVGGISYKVDEEQLKECFSKYGTVVEVKIIKDKFNNYQSKGYGFVTFQDPASADLVKNEAYIEFMGKMMNVGDAYRGGTRVAPGSSPVRGNSPINSKQNSRSHQRNLSNGINSMQQPGSTFYQVENYSIYPPHAYNQLYQQQPYFYTAYPLYSYNIAQDLDPSGHHSIVHSSQPSTTFLHSYNQQYTVPIYTYLPSNYVDYQWTVQDQQYCDEE